MVSEDLSREERPPYIQFERKAIEDKKETLRTGHYVAKNVDYVYVTMPGGRDVYGSRVDSWLAKQEGYARKNRIKPEWLDLYKDAYSRWKSGEEIPENGTPIKGWSALSPAQTETIIRAGIRTVEDLAVVNDEGLRRLGMGGRDLANKAKSWLSTASDTGKIALQNAQLEKENANLKVTVESLEEKVAILMRKVDSMDHTNYDVPRGTSEISADDILPETVTQDKIVDEVMSRQTGSSSLTLNQSLNKMYELKFGKPPHHRMKESTIRAKLEE